MSAPTGAMFLMALQRSCEVAFLDAVRIVHLYRKRVIDQDTAAKKLSEGRAVLAIVYNAQGRELGQVRVVVPRHPIPAPNYPVHR